MKTSRARWVAIQSARTCAPGSSAIAIELRAQKGAERVARDAPGEARMHAEARKADRHVRGAAAGARGHSEAARHLRAIIGGEVDERLAQHDDPWGRLRSALAAQSVTVRCSPAAV